MNSANCNCRCHCTLWALIASAIIGVIAAFLQITGIITVAPVFLWVVFGIAIVYLAVLMIAAALENQRELCGCLWYTLNAILIGILGTILLAVVLLAIGVAAMSIISALLVGLLLFFFALLLTNSACLVKCLFHYEN